jgi:NAD(P)-dependent dehydrogenase (short-subunit alcohol dehydrogenase family)
MPADADTALDFARLAPPAGARIAIVGGCGGIGRALVSACCDLRLNIAVLDLPRALAKYPPPARVRPLPTDAGDEASVGASFRSIAATWNGLDILVCLSGIAIIPPQRAEDLAVAQWDRIMQVNLRSAWLCARGAIPLMSNSGAIVNISSSLAFNPNKGFSAYVASKGGLVSLTKAIAAENGPGIRANVVAPSAVDTAFLGGGTADGGERPGADGWFKQSVESYVANVPLGRLANADDVVGPILFLAGPGARYITGQVIHVNGGRITP